MKGYGGVGWKTAGPTPGRLWLLLKKVTSVRSQDSTQGRQYTKIVLMLLQWCERLNVRLLPGTPLIDRPSGIIGHIPQAPAGPYSPYNKTTLSFSIVLFVASEGDFTDPRRVFIKRTYDIRYRYWKLDVITEYLIQNSDVIDKWTAYYTYEVSYLWSYWTYKGIYVSEVVSQVPHKLSDHKTASHINDNECSIAHR